MPGTQRHAIEARLARIEGHIHGVHRMAHEGKPYPQLVHQIVAIRSSLDSVLQAIVEDLAQEFVAAAPAKGRAAPVLEELRQVLASAR